MSTYSVSPIVVCYITVSSITLATLQLSSALRTASSSAAIIWCFCHGIHGLHSLAKMLWCCSILHLHFLNNCLHLMQLHVQLLLVALHRGCHMINRFRNSCHVLFWCLLLLQNFLYSCDHIAHRVCVVHSGVFVSEVGCFSLLSMWHPRTVWT